jgi:hypothetical protein
MCPVLVISLSTAIAILTVIAVHQIRQRRAWQALLVRLIRRWRTPPHDDQNPDP